jgi:Protein of unknown function (DUF2510)
MSTNPPPAGWYPDPSGAPGTRWWDGFSWSHHTQQPAAFGSVATATGPAVTQPIPETYAMSPTHPVAPTYAMSPTGWTSAPKPRPANQYALITLGVVALYLVVALSTGIVFIGVLPVLMSIRSLRHREPLAPVAIGAAIVSVVVAVAVLTHHH